MQQLFRRQLLALGSLRGDAARVDDECQRFIRSVLASDVDSRPTAEGVLDVLQRNGVASAVAARFTATFEAAIWPALGRTK
jgi:hypothetical protein